MIGHLDGEHILDIPPLAIIPHVIDLDGDGDKIPLFCIDHIDEDLSDREVFNVAILEVSSSIISIVAITSSSSLKSMIFSALRAVGMSVYPSDEASTIVPVIPTHTPTPTPTHTSIRTPTTPESDPAHFCQAPVGRLYREDTTNFDVTGLPPFPHHPITTLTSMIHWRPDHPAHHHMCHH
ncbi:hypothetical protein Hanom_Chr05g00404671 [Helianthus anomalus]